MLKLVALPILLTAVISSTNAQIFYSATLDPSQDGGGARSGSGTADLTLNGSTLSWHVTFSGLSAPSSAAHIHGPSTSPGSPAPTQPVLFPFTFTTGSTSGTIDGSVNNVTAGQIGDLNNGLWYVNVHSTAFPGGEIRGTITQVPEPSTVALASVAAFGMLALRRRRA